MVYRSQEYLDELKILIEKMTEGESIHYDYALSMEKKYGISYRTINRDEKDVIAGIDPRLQKTRWDKGKEKKPAKMENVNKVAELLQAGKSITDAVKIVAGKNDEPLNDRDKTKIVKAMKENKDELTNKDDKELSNYGGNFGKFIREYFEIDLIAHNKSIPVVFGDYSFTMAKHYVNDIILSIIHAQKAADSNSLLTLDRDAYFKSKLYSLIEMQLSLAGMSTDYKRVESLAKQYDRLKEKDLKITTNFLTIEKALQEKCPGITTDEIISLLKKHSTE